LLVNETTSLKFYLQNFYTPLAVTGVGFTDLLPDGLVVATPNGLVGDCRGGTITAIAGSGSIGLSGASLPGLTDCTFYVNVTATKPGTKTNYVSVFANEGQGNTAEAVLSVTGPYTVTVTNNGPNEVTGAVVTNPAPAGLTIGAWTCAVTSAGSGGVVTTACGATSGFGPLNTTANLKVGGVVTYTIAATVTATRGSVTNTATVKPPPGAINSGASCTTITGSNARTFDAVTGICSASDTDTVVP